MSFRCMYLTKFILINFPINDNDYARYCTLKKIKSCDMMQNHSYLDVFTKDRLHRLNIIQDGNLRRVLCSIEDESVEHLFLDCMFTWKVWCMCLSWRNLSWAVPNNLKLMFKSWCAVGNYGRKEKLWCSLLFSVVLLCSRRLFVR